jgi:dihydroneopterin aldolase/2-amino-4-hydroxy-6-hydroxymethyldihydropteridine diphosphokinase
VYESDTLIIPHVDMQNRLFVLKPLHQLNANYRHPLLGKTVDELLAALASEA